MGQQQLLLIILGVIIVGIAVAVGINMFSAQASSANRDAVAGELQNLASMAQQFYRRPQAMGGGNNSFSGWKIPGQLDTTSTGFYFVVTDTTGTTITDGVLTDANYQSFMIVGVGTEPGEDPEFDNINEMTGRVELRIVVTSGGARLRTAAIDGATEAN
jgi:Tfp pilus assembly protein PilE